MGADCDGNDTKCHDFVPDSGNKDACACTIPQESSRPATPTDSEQALSAGAGLGEQ